MADFTILKCGYNNPILYVHKNCTPKVSFSKNAKILKPLVHIPPYFFEFSDFTSFEFTLTQQPCCHATCSVHQHVRPAQSRLDTLWIRLRQGLQKYPEVAVAGAQVALTTWGTESGVFAWACLTQFSMRLCICGGGRCEGTHRNTG